MQATMKDQTINGDNITGDVTDPVKGSVEASKAPKEECPVVAPFTGKSKDEPTGVVESTNDDMREVVKEILYWEQPWLSLRIFLFVVWLYYSTLEGGYAPVNLICYLITLRLLAVSGPKYIAEKLVVSDNSLASTVGKMLKKSADYIEEMFQFPSSDQVSFVVQSIATSVEKNSCAAVRALNKAEGDISHLKIVLAHLLAFMILTSMFSLWNLFFIAIFMSMTAPVIYSKHHDKIDPMVEKAKTKAEPYVAKAKAKGEEVYTKVKTKADEVVTAAAAKYREKMGKKETKTE